jgi:hypothetical protein
MAQKIKVTAKIPATPNFIRMVGFEELAIDVKNIEDSELKKIGAEWTKNLIENAKKRRANNG